MRSRHRSRLLGLVCLLVQACLSIAPAGADICLKSLAESLATPEPVKTCCACCRDEEPEAPDRSPDHDCPPGCNCCITVPVLDRPAVTPAPPETESLANFVPLLVAMLPPPCEVATASFQRAPPRHPPPSFASELRSIRLVI